MVENDWRDEMCPGYGDVFCECPFTVITCPLAWDCDYIETIALSVLAYYDTNSSGALNPEDIIDSAHWAIM
jgi:hypothetical protein